MRKGNSWLGRFFTRSYPKVGSLFAERYELEEYLGGGAGSAVFRALDRRLNRLVALKLLSNEDMSPQSFARFQREAHTIARLTHSGIVTIYDFDDYEGLPYLVLELVAGRDLWRYLYEDEQRRLSPEEAVKICLNILEALDYAHQQGVIHRDLKPENVMLVDEELHTKVTDFGLAYIRGQSRITKEGIIAGSALYMPPEVADGGAGDHRADLYALGVMLYEMVLGRLPFEAENPLATIAMHLNNAPPTPSSIMPDISRGLEAIILKLLAKNPAERFASAQAVQNALKNLDQDQSYSGQTNPQHILDRISNTRPSGRETEWRRLRDLWRGAQFESGNQPHTAMLLGEAGSGKSQTAHDLLNEARGSGAKVLSAHCFPTTMALPYQPISEMLRDYLRQNKPQLDPEQAAILGRLVPEIGQDSAPDDTLPSLPAEAERQRLYEQLTAFLIDISTQQPLLILMEDLHCADASSIAALQYMARHFSSKPIMILGTYRPSELTHQHPLDATLQNLLSQNLVERIFLRRLPSPDVQSYIETVFGLGIDPALAQVIHDKTQGNFFFIKELLKSLVLDRHIYWDEAVSAWRVSGLHEVALPSSIRSIIGQKLESLEEQAAQVLAVAALIGSEFRFETLQASAQKDEETILKAIEQAIQAQLIKEKKNSREEVYLFENLLIQQTLLDGLSHRMKSRLHLQIAKALESLSPRQRAEHVESIARHYALGARTDEDIQTAISYLEQAAEQASGIFALANALDLYNLALDLAQEDNSPESETRALTLREGRGLVHYQQGAFSEAAKDLEAVLTTPLVDKDTAWKRAVLLQLGQVYRRSERFEDAIRSLNDAVTLSRTLDDEALLADALYFLGATYWTYGQIAQASQHQEEGYAIVTRLGLHDEVAMRVLHGLAECCQRQPDYARMFVLAEESLRLARTLGNLEYQSENLQIIANARIERGEYAQAQAIHEENLAVTERGGLRWHRVASLAGYGLARALAGDYQGGIAWLKDAWEAATPNYPGFLLTMVWDYLGACYLDLEALSAAEEAFSISSEQAQRRQISWADAYSKALWATLQIRRNNLTVGVLLEETLEQARTHGDLANIALVYRALAELELARHDAEAALNYAIEMGELAKRFDQPIQIAFANRWQAAALLALDRPAAAQSLLEKTIEEAVTMRAPRLMWELHGLLAEVYSQTGQAEKAAACRRRVRTIIEERISNLKDRDLQRNLQGHLPPYSESAKLTSTLRLLVVADAFGQSVQDSIQDHLAEVLRCDALILLGDLPATTYRILREDFAFKMPGLCVLGNHDSPDWLSWLPRYDFEHLHTRLASLRVGGREISIGGLSGSERYKQEEGWLWDEREAKDLLRALPAPDILMTHTAPAPPPNYPADHRHQGLAAIKDYIDKHQPRLALHGHFHQNYQVQQGNTTVIGCYGAVLVQCRFGDDGRWEIETQSLIDYSA